MNAMNTSEAWGKTIRLRISSPDTLVRATSP
jgi:hypothetical protein